MSKIHRGGRSAEGEPLSAGRVEYLEAARARARAKHIRRTVIIVAALTIVILFATGMVGSSIARAKDLVDSVHIALTPASGWPQQTGITDPDNKSLFNTRVIFWINAQCCNSRFFYLYRIQRCIRIDLIRWKEYRLIGGFNDHIAIIFIAFDPAYIAFDRRRDRVILWKIIAILSISERLIYPAQ